MYNEYTQELNLSIYYSLKYYYVGIRGIDVEDMRYIMRVENDWGILLILNLRKCEDNCRWKSDW